MTATKIIAVVFVIFQQMLSEQTLHCVLSIYTYYICSLCVCVYIYIVL